MSFSRVLLALVVVFACSLSLIAAQGDPLTHCSPVTVDTFQVVTGASGDAPGAVLSIVNGTYPIQQYTVMLTSPYVGSSVFFTVALTPNSTINTPGTVGVQFTIALNGLLKTNSNGSPQIFNPNPLTGLATVEFTNWKGYLMSFTITNVLMLNVTETITVGQDVTTCSYVYTITMITPGTLTTGAFVTGDPQFVGLRGQSFQVHGVDGAVYNIISDASMQLNSRFTFLEGPRPLPRHAELGQAVLGVLVAPRLVPVRAGAEDHRRLQAAHRVGRRGHGLCVRHPQREDDQGGRLGQAGLRLDGPHGLHLRGQQPRADHQGRPLQPHH